MSRTGNFQKKLLVKKKLCLFLNAHKFTRTNSACTPLRSHDSEENIGIEQICKFMSSLQRCSFIALDSAVLVVISPD